MSNSRGNRLTRSLRAAALPALAGLAVSAPTETLAQTLVWSDEFDGTSLNSSNWEPLFGTGTAYGLPAGWGNNELQYYTDRPQNVYVQNGQLHIVARSENYAGSNYTSARLRTRNLQEFLYGRIEARIKLPSGQGIWPAFWMLPTGSPYGGWASGGEIDIMESTNFADEIYGTIHFGGNWPNNTYNGGTIITGEDFSQDFHVYAIEWRPTEIRWFLDGQQYYVLQNNQWYSDGAPGNPLAPFDSPFHLLLNVAVGGNFPGNPNGGAGFPMEMVVDWVRVYELGSQAPFDNTPLVIPGRIEAEEYDLGGPGLAYFDADASNNGGQFRPDEGVDIEAASPTGFNVGWLRQGEWIEYTADVQYPGRYRVTSRVASNNAGGGEFRLELDGSALTGPIAAPGTGGWQNWTTVQSTLELPAGEVEIRFQNLGTDAQSFNIDWFEFEFLSCLGDANGDLFVNFTDVTEVLGNWLNSYSPGSGIGDANLDGIVDFSDLTTILSNWLATCD